MRIYSDRSFRITFAGGRSIKTTIARNELTRVINFIIEGCENDIDFLITDLDNEEDIVFLNAHSLRIRRYAYDFENFIGNRPPEIPELGIEQSESEFHKIATLFHLRETSRPAPSIVDDWDTYGEWMQHILE